MHAAWWPVITGILSCLAGVLIFFRNFQEPGRDWRWSILFFIAGVVLIGWGTATYFNLV